MRALLQGSSPQLHWPKVIQLTRRHAPRLCHPYHVWRWSVDRASFHKGWQCHGAQGEDERWWLVVVCWVDWATMGMPDTLGSTVPRMLKAIASTGECQGDDEEWILFGKVTDVLGGTPRRCSAPNQHADELCCPCGRLVNL